MPDKSFYHQHKPSYQNYREEHESDNSDNQTSCDKTVDEETEIKIDNLIACFFFYL